MKKYKHGFVFGKFMPVHKGHLHMIHTAEANCEELTILVCSLKSEPIAGTLRFMWMKELMPEANVIHIIDEVPQYPHEHPDFWQIWTKLLTDNIHPESDVVFTSENYGFEVAERLGIKHELVDIDRKTVPVSGTAIRTNPFGNWQHIPDNVKPYFSKKFVFVGNECTGKTTMSKRVAEHFNNRFGNAEWIHEYGREYCEQMGKAVLDESDFKNIAWGQLYCMNQGIAKGKKLNIIDTDLTVTEAYAKTYLGYCPEFVSALNKIMSVDLHILMDIDLPWEQDETRIYIKPEQRQEHFKIMKDTLDRYGCNYVVISGIGETRFINTIAAIESFLFQKQLTLC